MLSAASVVPFESAMAENSATPSNAESSPLSISMSAFPTDLQEDLKEVEAVRRQESSLHGTVVEDALRIYVNHKKKRLKFDRFDERLKSKLASLDTNHDDFIAYSELEDAVDRVRFLRCLLFGMVICSLLLLGSIFGLVYVVVDLQKV